MLNENNNPGQDDSWLEKEVTAAMHDYARGINDAPPLRLATGFSLDWPRVPRWQAWLVPVAVAAVIVSLAVSGVLIRNIRNGGAVPGTGTAAPRGGGTASVANGTTATNPAGSGPVGVPRYYMAVQSGFTKAPGKPPVQTYDLVAGDTRTGKTVTAVAMPTNRRITSVSAAGDDRTFVAAAQIAASGTAQTEFYKIRLTPGAALPAQVSLLPIKRQAFGTAKSLRDLGGGFQVALSSSGTELAVVNFSDNSKMAVEVFSVATGKLVQKWTTTTLRSGQLSTAPTLTWIDGDRALALATLGAAVKQHTVYVAWQNVRSLKVGGPGGDLIKDSTELRHALVGADWGDLAACGYQLQWPPVISADGKTFTCTTGGAFVTWVLKAGIQGLGEGHVVLSESKNDFVSNVLWANETGSTLILEWGIKTDGTVHYGNTKFSQVAAVSQGKATQLHFPAGFKDGLDASTIAW